MDREKTENGHWIFTPYITRGGKRIYASRYGRRAWKIWIPAK
jgi:Fe-S cluster biosynthesis and repair protein YggX